MFLSQTLAQIPDPLARWCTISVCDDCEPLRPFSSSRAWQPTRTLQGLYSWYAVSIKAPLRPRVVAVGSIEYRVLSTPFFPRDSSQGSSYPPYPIPVDGRSYNSKHTHLFACISRQPPVHLMERVRSAESHPRLPIKIVRQARMRPLGSPLDPSPSPPSLSCPYSLWHCLYLLPHRAILYSPLFSYRTSCLRVRCLLRKTRFVSSRDFRFFCPLSFFILSPRSVRRHLALYNSQVAISEFESFESITHIQDST